MLDQNYNTYNLEKKMDEGDDMLIYSENEYEALKELGPMVCEDGGLYTGQWLGK